MLLLLFMLLFLLLSVSLAHAVVVTRHTFALRVCVCVCVGVVPSCLPSHSMNTVGSSFAEEKKKFPFLCIAAHSKFFRFSFVCVCVEVRTSAGAVLRLTAGRGSPPPLNPSYHHHRVYEGVYSVTVLFFSLSIPIFKEKPRSPLIRTSVCVRVCVSACVIAKETKTVLSLSLSFFLYYCFTSVLLQKCLFPFHEWNCLEQPKKSKHAKKKRVESKRNNIKSNKQTN